MRVDAYAKILILKNLLRPFRDGPVEALSKFKFRMFQKSCKYNDYQRNSWRKIKEFQPRKELRDWSGEGFFAETDQPAIPAAS